MIYAKIVAAVALAALPMFVSAEADSNLTASSIGEAPATYKESSAEFTDAEALALAKKSQNPIGV